MRDDSIVIVGTVTLAPARSGNAGPTGQRDLRLDWVVMGADGRELGKLHQKNTVAAEALENDWPIIARGISVGAARGIGDILEKVSESALSGAAAGSEQPAR